MTEAEMLKNDIMKYQVQSRFCVIGVGNYYDANFLDKMSSIGNEQGFVTSIEPQDFMGSQGADKAADFASKALKNLEVTEGVYLDIAG
jgi:hypothetical protein